MTTQQEKPKRGIYESAGGLLWREDLDGKQLAVIHRPKHDDWSLPKGALEKKETWQEAALREVREETQCKPRLGEFAGSTCYRVYGVPKVVLFWHMDLVKEKQFAPNDEVDALLWLSLDEALCKLSYADELALLRSVSLP